MFTPVMSTAASAYRPTTRGVTDGSTPRRSGHVAAMIDAWLVNVSGGPVWSDPINVPFLAAFGAATLLFTGAGRFSLDAKVFDRPRWPAAVGVALLVAAVAAAVATWVLLNGTNPLHLTSE